MFYIYRALEQTRSYIEKVVTTKNVNDCRLLAVEIRKFVFTYSTIELYLIYE